MFAKAKFDCHAEEQGELSFSAGEFFSDVVVSQEQGWYQARHVKSGMFGLVPANYVDIVDRLPEQAPPALAPKPKLAAQAPNLQAGLSSSRSNETLAAPVPPVRKHKPRSSVSSVDSFALPRATLSSETLPPKPVGVPVLPPKTQVSQPPQVPARQPQVPPRQVPQPPQAETPPRVPPRQSAQSSPAPIRSTNPFLKTPAPVLPMPEEDYQRFEATFLENDTDQDGYLSGMEVRDIFSLSGLSNDIMGAAWECCDVDQDGLMHLREFVMGMWLLYQHICSGTPIPDALSQKQLDWVNEKRTASSTASVPTVPVQVIPSKFQNNTPRLPPQQPSNQAQASPTRELASSVNNKLDSMSKEEVQQAQNFVWENRKDIQKVAESKHTQAAAKAAWENREAVAAAANSPQARALGNAMWENRQAVGKAGAAGLKAAANHA